MSHIYRAVGIGTTCIAMAVQVERNSGLKINKNEACARVYFKHYKIIIISRFVAGVHEPLRQEANTVALL